MSGLVVRDGGLTSLPIDVGVRQGGVGIVKTLYVLTVGAWVGRLLGLGTGQGDERQAQKKPTDEDASDE